VIWEEVCAVMNPLGDELREGVAKVPNRRPSPTDDSC
jgi:hypothetical protein